MRAVRGPGGAVCAGTSDYPTKARRPANSRLNDSLLQEGFALCSLWWQVSLKCVVKRLIENGPALLTSMQAN